MSGHYNKATTNTVSRDKTVHTKKLHNLGYSSFEELPPDNVIFNLSSRNLTSVEESLLSKGLKFALPPERLSLEKYLFTFEKLYQTLQQ